MRLFDRLVRGRVDTEVDDELAFHIEMTMRDLIAQGKSPREARAEAERRFGDSAAVRAACRRFGQQRDRRVNRAEFWSEMRQDVRFAFRQLARSKSFTIIAVVTLALGIGATAAMFGVLDAVVLKALPFSHSERIVVIHTAVDGNPSGLTPPEYLGFRQVRAFEHVAAARLGGGVAMQFGDVPAMVDAAAVTAEYFAVFGVRPELGRVFTDDEDRAGGPPVIMLSHRVWVARFNRDSSVINRMVQVDGVSRGIIGVMPASFDYLKGSADVWTPLALGPEAATQFGAHYLMGYARLRSGVTVEQAKAAAGAAQLEVASRIPGRSRPLRSYTTIVRDFTDNLVQDYRALLYILLGAVGFVLLIACSNVANLLLARGTTRTRELAIRAALGAGHGRLVRQLLTESLVLALGGAIAGLVVAFGLLRLLPLVSAEEIPRLEQAHIDWRVLAVTLGLAVASSVLCGLAPAVRVSRANLEGTLRDGARGSGLGRDGLRSALVAAQVALTLVLLAGSGLLIRSAWAIQHVDPGFKPDGVLTSRIVLPAARYATGDAVVRAYAAIRDDASQIPGAERVALTSVVPLSGSSMRSNVLPEDQASGSATEADLRLVSDGYFTTMGVSLLAGRDISRGDEAGGVPVAVVNAAMVRAMWPGLDLRAAIGRRLRVVPTRRADLPNWEIVGVVSDLHNAALTKSVDPEVYTPYQQTDDKFWPFLARSMVVVIRLRQQNVPPETLREPLQRVIARIDPGLPIADAKSMNGYLAESLATARMNTLLLSLLAGIALVLAMVGIYGVVGNFVSARTREIGVRVALGGTPATIWLYVARRGLAPIAVGLAIGLTASLATSRFLQAQLFGVTSSDPLTLAAVASTMIAVALAAIYWPARRAMRVSPVVALASE